jgi:hypothetical protein
MEEGREGVRDSNNIRVSYLMGCMFLQTINPAVANSITELFFLPVKNVLPPPMSHHSTCQHQITPSYAQDVQPDLEMDLTSPLLVWGLHNTTESTSVSSFGFQVTEIA